MSFTAAGLAAAITAAQGPSQDTAIQDEANLKLATGIVTYIESNLQFVIPSGAIVTTGSAATQTGPAAPLMISAAP